MHIHYTDTSDLSADSAAGSCGMINLSHMHDESPYNIQAGIISEAYKNIYMYEYSSPFYRKHHIVVYNDQYILSTIIILYYYTLLSTVELAMV